MKLLANENFPLNSVKYLIEKNYDVKAVGIHNASVSDEDVIQIAINEERLIITFDRDYGTLIFKHNLKPAKGVLYLRLDKYDAEEPGRLVHELLSGNKYVFDKTLTVFDGTLIRQRKY